MSKPELTGVSPGRRQKADEGGGLESVPIERSGFSHGLGVWRSVSRPCSTSIRSGQFLCHTQRQATPQPVSNGRPPTALHQHTNMANGKARTGSS